MKCTYSEADDNRLLKRLDELKNSLICSFGIKVDGFAMLIIHGQVEKLLRECKE